MSDRIYVMNEGRIVGGALHEEATPGGHHVLYFEVEQRRVDNE